MAKKGNGMTAAEKAEERKRKRAAAKGGRYVRAGERKQSKADTKYARATAGTTPKAGTKKTDRARAKGATGVKMQRAGKAAKATGVTPPARRKLRVSVASQAASDIGKTTRHQPTTGKKKSEVRKSGRKTRKATERYTKTHGYKPKKR